MNADGIILFYVVSKCLYLRQLHKTKRQTTIVVCSAYCSYKRRALDSNQRIPYDIGSLANCWFKPLTQPSLNHLFERVVQIYNLFCKYQNILRNNCIFNHYEFSL